MEDRRNYTWFKEYLDQIIDSNKTEHASMMQALAVHIDAHIALNGRLGSLESWRAWSKGVAKALTVILGGLVAVPGIVWTILSIVRWFK